MVPSPRLAEITPENIDAAIEIKVRLDQQAFVSPVVHSLAEAFVHPGRAWPRLILDGERVVGFVMAFFDIEFGEDGSGTDVRSGLWRLNIAAAEQGRGYGRFAVTAVADEIRRRGGCRVTTTWLPGKEGPEEFYIKLGFRRTGEVSDKQCIGELALT